MKKVVIILAMAIASTSLTSCLTTHTDVGNYATTPGKAYKMDKERKLWIFWGLLPINNPNVSTPLDGNCRITTKFTFGDFLISGLTGGLITSYTIKSYGKSTN